jgi:hypothetical protein
MSADNAISTVGEFAQRLREHHCLPATRYAAPDGKCKLGIMCRFIIEIPRPSLLGAVPRHHK